VDAFDLESRLSDVPVFSDLTVQFAPALEDRPQVIVLPVARHSSPWHVYALESFDPDTGEVNGILRMLEHAAVKGR
jgi:hypothetical protein